MGEWSDGRVGVVLTPERQGDEIAAFVVADAPLTEAS
jgi:hypothetical protein